MSEGLRPSVPLKRIFRVATGATPKSGEARYWNGDITWVTPEDLSTCDGAAVSESARMITEDGYLSCATTYVQPGSIVLSTRAPIGYAALANTRLCFNQGCKALVPLRDEHSKYWLYAISASREGLRSYGRGSTYAELGTQQLKDYRVPRPTVPEQRFIADYLDAETARIDALIDRKQRFIDLLLEKRTAMITYAVTKGLDPSVEMQDSGIDWFGAIPASWTIDRFPRVVDLREGPGILSPDFRDAGTPLLKVGNLTGDIVTLQGCYFLDPDDVKAKWQRFVLQEGDLLISGSASLGGSSVVTAAAVGCVPYTGVIRLRPITARMTRSYLRYLLWSATLVEQVRLLGAGIGIKHFGPSHLARVWLPVPPLDEQTKVAKYLDEQTEDLDHLVGKTRTSVNLLREYRTALISAAVTGQIDIPGAEASEEVA